MADLLTDEQVGLTPPKGPADGLRILSDADVGLAPTMPADRPPTLQERSQQVYGFDNLAERGTLLPVGETQEGKFTFAVPQIIKDMAETALLPGHVLQGGSATPEDATRFTLDWLAPATSGRAPGAKAPPSKGELVRTAPSTEQLQASAVGARSAAVNSGVQLSDSAQNRLLGRISGIATAERVRPGRADSIVSLLKNLKDDLGRQPAIEDIVQQRQLIQDAISDGTPTAKRIGMKMLDAFDDFMDEISTAPRPDDIIGGVTDDVAKNLKAFRVDWSRAMKSDAIERIVNEAQLAASGFENGIRMGFKSLLKNPKRLRGFTPDERKLMERIVMGKGANLWKLLGKFGYGLRGNNMLGGTIGTASGGALGGPAGAAAVPMVGQLGSRMAEGVTLRNAELARAMAATGGKMPPNAMYRALIDNLLTRNAAGPLAGTQVPQPAPQPQGPQGQTIRLKDGSMVTLDPNVL